ncbi:uncharacterized protein LOC121396630 [Xenopus laevis]|uniref:TIR domain-containing protein n=2 Tax=Xenopus laevis TaxID=8355 RepID=A0A974CED6_XENLA|nr:uncharacterized protein LOC121396630 [Xenopus laevis]OCT71106.1 hypothetical protein XELAEV_18038015mg [Xenopus laevis]
MDGTQLKIGGMRGWLKQMFKKDQQKPARPPKPETISKFTSDHSSSSSDWNHLVPEETSPPPNSRISWPEHCKRWSRHYDAYICHSERDSDYAIELLHYLEAQPEDLRCFLPIRNLPVGGPIPSEICSSLRNSHCWIMLLTAQFLADGWCQYHMHQALAESPLSEGRIIPVMINLQMSQYPSELRFMHAIRSQSCDASEFCKIRDGIYSYMINNLQTIDSTMERKDASSSNIDESSDETHKSCSSTMESKCQAEESSINMKETSCEAQTPCNSMHKISTNILEISTSMQGRRCKAQKSCRKMEATEISSRDMDKSRYETQESGREMQGKAGIDFVERHGEAQQNCRDMQESSCQLQGSNMDIQCISDKTQIYNIDNCHDAQNPCSSAQQRHCDTQRNNDNVGGSLDLEHCSLEDTRATKLQIHYSNINTQTAQKPPSLSRAHIYTRLNNGDTCEGALILNQKTGSCTWTSSWRSTNE